MADIQQFFIKYKEYNSSFKETSYDDKKSVFLCTDTSIDVVNFDLMVKDKYAGKRIRPRSFDAIYLFDTTLYLVEFKNQLPSKINSSDIQEKLTDGKSELNAFLADCKIQRKDYLFKYCVVYKNYKKPYDKYKRGVSNNIIEFGLEKLNYLVDGIKTDCVSEFTQLLNNKLTTTTLKCENI